MTLHRSIHADAKTTTETEILHLRQRLAKAHRILTAGGIWPLTKGHVSARVPATDKVLILGHIHSEGRSLIDTDVDDIVTVDLEGNWLEGRIEPVDERFLHLEIMKARPEITSVVHAHPTYATAFGIAGVNILPVGNRGAIFAPEVPILDFDRQIDTPERGRMVCDAIGDGMAVILKNHGVAVCGDSIENAVIATFSLEETAQLHWIAAQLGPVQKISTGEVRSVLIWANGLVILLAAAFSLHVIVHLLLGVPVVGSVELFLAGAAIYLFALSSLSILLATITNSMPQFALLSIPVFVVMFSLSGSFTPFESMPVLLQDAMYISPSTHFVRFGQAVLYRGAGMGVVWPDLAIMAGLGGVFLAVALSRFRTMLAWQS